MGDNDNGRARQSSDRLAKRRKKQSVRSTPEDQPREDDLQIVSQAVQDALNNDLILETILSILPTRILVRECCLASKQWNRASRRILKNRPDACVRVYGGETDVKALISCIKSSADFPFRNISLESDQNFSLKEWLKMDLLRQHASLFTTLQLDFDTWEMPHAVLTGLLSGPFQHVLSLSLDLDYRDCDKKDRNEFLDRLKLLNLVKLKSIYTWPFERCSGVDLDYLEALLQSCPNLKRFENCTYAFLPALSTAGKLETVKSLRVCPNCVHEDTKDYPVPSTVETLTIDKMYHDQDSKDAACFFPDLEPVLKCNQQSLRRIEVMNTVTGGTNVNDWPKMTSLTYLKIMKPCEFPDSVDEIFPALQTVQLGTEQNTISREKYFWRDPLPSVSRLEVVQPLTQEDWKSLSTALPNLRYILLDSHGCGMDCIKGGGGYLKRSDNYFWRGVSLFKHLETVCISPVELFKVDLDVFFTGIQKRCVNKLRAYPQLSVPSPDFISAYMRDAESVASLTTGLKELVMRFTTSDKITREDFKKKLFLSHVALQYGFNMVPPDIKIQFLYDHWSKNAESINVALSPVAERVTFGHWNANLES